MRPRQANLLRSTKAGAAASARHAPPALASNLVPCNGSRRRGVGSTAASPEPARGASGLLRVSRSGRKFPELAPRGRCITSGCSWPPAASGWRPPSPAAGRVSRGSERLRRGPPGGVWSPHGGRAAEPPSVSRRSAEKREPRCAVGAHDHCRSSLQASLLRSRPPARPRISPGRDAPRLLRSVLAFWFTVASSRPMAHPGSESWWSAPSESSACTTTTLNLASLLAIPNVCYPTSDPVRTSLPTLPSVRLPLTARGGCDLSALNRLRTWSSRNGNRPPKISSACRESREFAPIRSTIAHTIRRLTSGCS